MAMNDRHIRPIDERACEALLLFGDFVAPIRSPMKGDNGQIARLFDADDVFRGALRGRLGELRQEVDTGNIRCGGPTAGNAARYSAEGKDKYPRLTGKVEHRRCRGLEGIQTCAGSLDLQMFQRR